MPKVHVTAKRDFLESLTIARPIGAVAELIWNGFDAQSTIVQVSLDRNEMGGIQNIRIRDYGDGIAFSDVDALFGSLGESWKKNKGRLNGRGIHGKSGKGRFKAFSLGQLVEWNTTYEHEGKTSTYNITGSARTLDDFDVSAPVDGGGALTGTEVVISNVMRNFPSLEDESASLELAKIFAPYLTETLG